MYVGKIATPMKIIQFFKKYCCKLYFFFVNEHPVTSYSSLGVYVIFFYFFKNKYNTCPCKVWSVALIRSLVCSVNSSANDKVYPWEAVLPLFAISTGPGGQSSPPATPTPSSPQQAFHASQMSLDNEDLEGLPSDLLPTAEEDDDVFEAEPGLGADAAGAELSAAELSAAGKRRTQSLSAIHNSKEPRSPLKVCKIYSMNKLTLTPQDAS